MSGIDNKMKLFLKSMWYGFLITLFIAVIGLGGTFAMSYMGPIGILLAAIYGLTTFGFWVYLCTRKDENHDIVQTGDINV